MAQTTSKDSKTVVYAALLGNLAIALTKAVAAWLTGSSAMTSEAVHSLVDTGNEVLLLYGMWRAGRPADEGHPLGHGRELYFWCFVVALLVFALGAGVSLLQGLRHVLHPTPLEDVAIGYAVLGLSLVFEGSSWLIALRRFRAAKGKLGYYAAFRQSKDPTVFIVLFEDSAAVLGLVIAFAGTLASQWFDRPEPDGAASIAIALVLAVTAVFLARESKGLLIGEGARPEVTRSICRLIAEHPGVDRAYGLLTVHLAPRQIFVALSVDFADGLSAGQVEDMVAAMERHIKTTHPEVVTVFIKPQRAPAHRRDGERGEALRRGGSGVG